MLTNTALISSVRRMVATMATASLALQAAYGADGPGSNSSENEDEQTAILSFSTV
jgi:hypothetical protein